MEDEMAKEARTFQHDVATSDGTLKGDLHRAWIAIRDAVIGMSDAALASECEIGESHLLSKYDHILNSIELAAPTQSLLIRQRAEIGSNVMELRSILDRSTASTELGQ